MTQIYGTELRLDFAEPVTSIGFGAALNATASPGGIRVALFSVGEFIESHVMDLRRSSTNGANSNSEGTLLLSGTVMDTVRITNLGDGYTAASKFNWVLDNLTYERAPTPVPEPSTLLLALTAWAAVVGASRRTRR